MKVKFYKGPWHNKTREVRDGELAVVIAAWLPPAAYLNLEDPMNVHHNPTHIYHWSKHTHPDGSRFFVYGGKS